MPGYDHKKRQSAEEKKEYFSHLAVRSTDPGIVTLRLGVAVGRPKRSCDYGEDPRGLKKHFLCNGIRGDLIHGKEMCDQEGVDLEESDVADLEKKKIDSILVDATGGISIQGGEGWVQFFQSAAIQCPQSETPLHDRCHADGADGES